MANYSLTDYGLHNIAGYIAAVGDFNNDQHTDLFIIQYNSTTLEYSVHIYLWDNKQDEYHPMQSSSPHSDTSESNASNPVITTTRPIANIIVADFNFDGKLDILVTGPLASLSTTSTNNHNPLSTITLLDNITVDDYPTANNAVGDPNDEGYYYVEIYLGNLSSVSSKPDFSLDDPADQTLPIGQISTLDVNGDLKLDFYGMSKSVKDDKVEYRRTFWVYTSAMTNVSTYLDDSILDASQSSPQWPVYTALNGDDDHDDDDGSSHSLLQLSSSLSYAITYQFELDDEAQEEDPLQSHPYLSVYHAPILGDLDGDCMADLIVISSDLTPVEQYNLHQLTAQQANPQTQQQDDTPLYDPHYRLEIWRFDKKISPGPTLSNYQFHSSSALVIGAQQPTVADMNIDGTLDIIIPQCYPLESCRSKNILHIWYNEQKPMCSSPVSTGNGGKCRKQQGLCVEDENFTFGEFKIGSPQHVEMGYDATRQSTTTPIYNAFHDGEYFYRPIYTQILSYYNPPFMIRLGDANLDGYPDLFLPLMKTTNDDIAPAAHISISSTQDMDNNRHHSNNISTDSQVVMRLGTFTMSQCSTSIGCSSHAVDEKYSQFTAFTMNGIPNYPPNLSHASGDTGVIISASDTTTTTTTTTSSSSSSSSQVLWPQNVVDEISADSIIITSALIDIGNTGNLDLLILTRPKRMTSTTAITSNHNISHADITNSNSFSSITSRFMNLVSSVISTPWAASSTPSSSSHLPTLSTVAIDGAPHYNTRHELESSSLDHHTISSTLSSPSAAVNTPQSFTAFPPAPPPPPSPSPSPNQSSMITTYVNNFRVDAYFLTLLAGNGVCDAWCSSIPKFPKPKPFGAHYIGATFKFTITDLNGKKTPRISPQIPTTAFLGLHAPYQVMGLGRTNNYIEELFLGIPNTQGSHSNFWIAMIPNSQIVIFPYPPSKPSDWSLELFISPTQRLLWVSVAFIVSMVVCAATVLFLHVREKKDERKARKDQRQHFFAF